MPKRKEDTGTMLTQDFAAVESVSSFEQTEAATAVADNYGDTTTAALADIEKDRKTWRALVFEVVDGASEPPEFLLKKLSYAVGLSEMLAQMKFREDVKAIIRLNQSEKAKTVHEEKLAKLEKQHGTEADLQSQLKEMLQSEQDLRSLINTMQNEKRIVGQKTAASRRIGASFSRLF